MAFSLKRSAVRAVLYSVLAAAAANVIFQFVVTWRQFDSLIHAQPVLVLAAILNQIVAYGVLVPAMGRFFERVGIGLSQWRTFALISAGLASTRVIPGGDYIVWRMSLRRHHGGVAATTQWFILYTIGMSLALAILFMIFEVLTLWLHPQPQAVSLVENLRYVPVAAFVLVAGFMLALRIQTFRRWVLTHAFEQFTDRSLSPMGIIKEHKLDWRDGLWMGFAAFGTWMIEGYTLYLCFAALGLHVPFVMAICGYCFSRLIANLPLSPGGIGEMEASSALFFATYGYPVGLIITATFLHRLITYWPPLAIGALAYSLAGRHGVRDRIDLGLQPFARDLHLKRPATHKA